MAICYDRHYPEYMRALAVAGADLVVVPQAGAVGEWPDGLYEAEMRVAAFQNGYYVALCNRVGEEDCLTFAGESFVCGPEGRVVRAARRGCEDSILYADVDLDATSRSHARRLFLRDRRPESVRRVGRPMRAAARAVTVALAGLSLLACSGIQVQVGVYQTLEEAGRPERSNTAGYPAGLPESTSDLREGHLPDGRLWGAFSFDPARKDALESLVATEIPAAASTATRRGVSSGGHRSCDRPSIWNA